ncbi:hypothetical protein MBLNU13_g02887t4 [Cladosporium sp. NU13]
MKAMGTGRRIRITHVTHDAGKTNSAHEESVTSGFFEPKPTFKTKFKRHCARFWWLHLIIFVVGFLATTFPMFDYPVYPFIAQNTVNDAKVTINSLRLSNPAPDGFELAINTTFSSNPMYKADLDAFNSSLYLPGSDIPFVSVTVPASTSGASTELIINQRVVLEHPEEITRYSIITFSNETYSYYLKGKGHLKLGPLPKISVKYDKTVEQKGLNGLLGFKVAKLHPLLFKDDVYHANTKGKIMLPNPSVITIDSGNVTATMSVAGVPISNITMPNLSLRPGNNTYTFYSTTHIAQIVAMLKKGRSTCGKLPVDITPDASTYNGQKIEYMSKALQAAPMKIDLDVGPVLKSLKLGFLLDQSCKDDGDDDIDGDDDGA